MVRLTAAAAIRAIISLIFCPRRFVRLAVEHDVEREFETNLQLREAHPDRRLPPERLKAFEENARERMQKVRRGLAGAFGIVFVTLAAGVLSGGALRLAAGPQPKGVGITLQLAGGGILLGATLSFLGWEILSWKGQTLPEKVNRWLYRSLYALGTYLFVVAVSW